MSITLRMYAEKKRIALQSVEVCLSHQKVHVKDYKECETKIVMLDEIQSQIHVKGNLSTVQRHRLLEIATRCPVHRTLSSTLEIRSELVYENNSLEEI